MNCCWTSPVEDGPAIPTRFEYNMEKIHRKFLATQFLYSGVSNAILNGVALYLSNRTMQPLSWIDAAIDAFITCGFVSLLVTLPTAYFTRKAVQAGMPTMNTPGWLSRNKWLLWLELWFLAVIVMETVFAGIYGLTGLKTISFTMMLIFRFCWCGLLGGTLGALVGARFLTR